MSNNVMKNIKKDKLISSIKTINDVFVYANDIIKNVEKSTDFDPICKIEINGNNTNCEPKNVISGSKAVTTFLELLREGQKKAVTNGVRGCGPFLKLADYYKANDTDIFFLDSKEHSRLKYENIDIVHIKTPNITEHLDNFDISCCKTSMSIDGKTFWVSLHCLYTMLTGNCFIPKYLEKPESFRTFYNKPNNISTKKDFEAFYEPKDNKTDKCTMMFIRLNGRIEKYRERGYTFQYVETDKALSWLTSNHMDSYMLTDHHNKSVKFMD